MTTSTKEPTQYSGERIDVRDVLIAFLYELSQLERKRVAMNARWQALRVKGLMAMSENNPFRSIRSLNNDEPFWEKQEYDFVSSNLGDNKGFIFFFICNGCGRRTRYLYHSSFSFSPRCRQCEKIPYPSPNRKERMMSKLMKKTYLTSSDRFRVAQRLGITKEEL